MNLDFHGLPMLKHELKRLRPLDLIAERYKWKSLLRDRMVFTRSKPKEPIKKAKVTLTRHSSRVHAMDSLVMSFVGIVDGLLEYRVIDRDSTIEYKTMVCSKKYGRINIEVLC